MSEPIICPVCGQHKWEPGVTPPDVPVCTHLTCPAWSLEAKFDHETRQWLPVDADGFVIDGRHESEVQ